MLPIDLRSKPYDAKFRGLRRELADEPSYMTVFSKVDRTIDRVIYRVYLSIMSAVRNANEK